MFLVNSERIHAHKAIISLKCEYFATMFKNDWKESEDNVVDLKQISTVAFKLILEYIYTGKLKAETEQDSLEVLELSKLYLLHDLEIMVAEKIKSSLTMLNVFAIMRSAQNIQLEYICLSCYKFLSLRFLSVFNGKNYLGMTYGAWDFILEKRKEERVVKPKVSSSDLDSDWAPFHHNREMTVFSALLEWAQNYSNDLKDKEVQELFSKIRLNMIAPKDLVGNVRRSNVYDINFLLDIVEKNM